MSESYQISIAKIKRDLPIVPIKSDLAIASFVMLGDAELAHVAAVELSKAIDFEFDYIVTPETKGIPLAQEISRQTGNSHYIVIRKNVKSYMTSPLVVKSSAITTATPQTLVLDGKDAKIIHNKKVLVVDDVISTGGSLKAVEKILFQAGAHIVGKFAILAEGQAEQRDDITFLATLPLFKLDGDGHWSVSN
ncbi:phosphoribosyltransferase family protein [Leuconostoc pseudomesenteroides]|uniref:phosphoribosyltransferase family protein n=1 Tax=Leuconostoc pseudomesenteroides TaxID=33968 RepID=UPI00345EFA81